jgi:Tfp pilus assembly protein PilO
MKPKIFFSILLGLIAVILAAGVGAYYLAFSKLVSTSSSYSQQLSNQAESDSMLAAIRKLEFSYKNNVRPIIPLMDSALPRNKNQTELLTQIKSIASESGLSITNINFATVNGLPSNVTQTTPNGSVLALPINFQLDGSYAQLQQFLFRAEKLKRLTNITTLSVTKNDKAISYAITMNAYIMP